MSSRILQKGVNRLTQAYSAGHKAVDIGRTHLTGEPVIAHSAGKVVFCQTGQKNNKGSKGNASYGNCVKIDHGSGYSTLYAHLASVTVRLGQAVTQGQVIGTMGNTGNSYGMHLHFEVRKDNVHVDPTPYLEADLPLDNAPKLHYRLYTGGKWLPWVTGCNDKTAQGFAGVVGAVASALQAKTDRGTVEYRVHLLGGKWLPWVNGTADFAGVRGKAFDAVQLRFSGVAGYDVEYRMSPADSDYYGKWCYGSKDEYAGVFGRKIDLVQARIVKKA